MQPLDPQQLVMWKLLFVKEMNKYFGKYDTRCERSRIILRLKHSNYIKMQKWLLMVKSKNIKYSHFGLQYINRNITIVYNILS